MPPLSPVDVIQPALDAFCRPTNYQLYKNYYDGNHRLSFATEKFKNAFGALFRELALNLCPMIIDNTADRLTISGFDMFIADPEENVPTRDILTGEIERPPVDSAVRDARIIWRRNRMGVEAHTIHTEALKYGEAYLMIWPDETGMPRFWVNGAEFVRVKHSEKDRLLHDWAAKMWQDDKKFYRLTVYTPDGIARYITTGSLNEMPKKADAFTAYDTEEEPHFVDNPFGRVPVFHFVTNPDVNHSGRSDLHDVIPMQDAVNKALLDMLVGQEYHAFPQRFVTGIEVEIDPVTGEPIDPFKAMIDRLWVTANPDAKFGQFPQVKLDQIHQNLDGLIEKTAIVARVPLHFVTPLRSDFPSGESQKTAESPFTAKIRDRMLHFGAAWEAAMSFAVQILNNTTDEEAPDLIVKWADPTPRAQSDQYNGVKLLSDAGASLEGAAYAVGMTDAQVMVLAATARPLNTEVLPAVDADQSDEPQGGRSENGNRPPELQAVRGSRQPERPNTQ